MEFTCRRVNENIRIKSSCQSFRSLFNRATPIAPPLPEHLQSAASNQHSPVTSEKTLLPSKSDVHNDVNNLQHIMSAIHQHSLTRGSTVEPVSGNTRVTPSILHSPHDSQVNGTSSRSSFNVSFQAQPHHIISPNHDQRSRSNSSISRQSPVPIITQDQSRLRATSISRQHDNNESIYHTIAPISKDRYIFDVDRHETNTKHRSSSPTLPQTSTHTNKHEHMIIEDVSYSKRTWID
jgi:hypothetical protein